MSQFNTIYFNCFAINFFLHTIIYKYLLSLLIIISIKLYLFLVSKFVNLNNLIIKFIVILFYSNLDSF